LVLVALLKLALHTQFQPLFQFRRLIAVQLLHVESITIQLFTFSTVEFRFLFAEWFLGPQQFQQFRHQGHSR
jgi:hypothetical protein